jgi:SAM-dependent methyltransferase
MRTLNRVLTNEDRELYSLTIKNMFGFCPEMMSRKISEANVQQAFVFEAVRGAMLKSGGVKVPLLCVGSFEDTACASLKASGIPIFEIDPDVNGLDLHKFFVGTDDKFDIIFSTSVIEHVKDDEQFISEICQLLLPGGQAILTMDFKEGYKTGDPLPYSDVRFYTNYDLKTRLPSVLGRYGCQVAGEQDYSDIDSFVYQGHVYSFATFAFRKTENV